MDVACGTGDQLWRLYDKIEYGLGIDVNEASIQYARRRLLDTYGEDSSSSSSSSSSSPRIEYRMQDLHDFLRETDDRDSNSNSNSNGRPQFDVVMATLFFHVLPWDEAVATLSQMANLVAPDGCLIIGAFVPPANNWKDRVLLWFDQRFTNHYANFQNYIAKGGMAELVGECATSYRIDRILDTNDGTIKIFVLKVDPN